MESLPFLLPKITPLAHSSDWCAEKGFGLHRGIQEIDFLSVRQPWKSQSEGSMLWPQLWTTPLEVLRLRSAITQISSQRSGFGDPASICLSSPPWEWGFDIPSSSMSCRNPVWKGFVPEMLNFWNARRDSRNDLFNSQGNRTADVCCHIGLSSYPGLLLRWPNYRKFRRHPPAHFEQVKLHLSRGWGPFT